MLLFTYVLRKAHGQQRSMRYTDFFFLWQVSMTRFDLWPKKKRINVYLYHFRACLSFHFVEGTDEGHIVCGFFFFLSDSIDTTHFFFLSSTGSLGISSAPAEVWVRKRLCVKQPVFCRCTWRGYLTRAVSVLGDFMAHEGQSEEALNEDRRRDGEKRIEEWWWRH